MASIKTGHKTYPLNQSPLYKLKSRRKLACQFDLTLGELERLAKRTDNYRVFTIGKGTPKSRQVEVPKPHLERVHRRLFSLLSRITPPPYLHSGVRGRSYITNANAHLTSTRLVTLDIRKFFPSTLGWHVFEFFHEVMHCSRDVSGLLAALVTIDDHVPTGSCISQAMAFYAHYEMFEEIWSLSKSLALVMTVYVDDVAISGDKANRSTLYKVRGILKKRGLQSPARKEFVYDIGYPKRVTGSIIANGALRLPNRKHKQIHAEIISLLDVIDSEDKLCRIESTIGRVVAANQSDPALADCLKKLREERLRLGKVVLKVE